MNFPWTFAQGLTISVLSLESDGFGGTTVTATFADCPVKPFVLQGDWKLLGADSMRADIVSVILDQIETAMELAE